MATKSHTSKGIVLLLTCAAQFMVVLDIAIVNVALPSIQRDLGIGPILAVTFAEGPERNRALGIYGAVTGISASVGVIASGLLTSGPGWRWIFFINVPIGVILIALAAAFLPADASTPAAASASTPRARSP